LGTTKQAILRPDGRFENWSGRVDAKPARLAQPATLEEIQRTVRAHQGGVRVVGTGHSCTPLCATQGTLVNLDRYAGVIDANPQTKHAAIRAGSKIHDLGPPLREHGLAFHNQGDVDVQSLAGAVSTGTHGTGPGLGSMSTAVRRIGLVLADGDTLTCSAEIEPEVFRVARVSLGALGIIYELEVELVDAYNLHQREWKADVSEADRFLDLARETRHLEFFWAPSRDVLYMKTLDSTDAPPDPMHDRPRELVGPSHEVFPSIREERFNEMEFAVPAERGSECFREIREVMRERHPEVFWPVEVRTLAADDIPLSPAYERASVTISVHQAADLPCDALFADTQAVFANHGGRPHWGKFHDLDAKTLAPLYPEWDAFLLVRERLDPEGRFANDYLRGVLGF